MPRRGRKKGEEISRRSIKDTNIIGPKIESSIL
jgi:hypothetical protein